MGLFSNKQAQTQAADDAATHERAALIDETLREELRSDAREYLKEVIDENNTRLSRALDDTVARLSSELQTQMSAKLDAAMAQVNTTLAGRLDERLAEYDRVTKDAQDQAVQSLNRNAQNLHEKYQQLTHTLQQTVTSQEVMMITVFEDSKSRISEMQAAQENAVASLNKSAQISEQQSEAFTAALRETLAEQQTMVTNAFQETMDRIASAKSTQDAAIATLSESADSLAAKTQALSASLDQALASHKASMTSAFESNMAQVVEHYVLGALGDQYDLKAQLPSIIQQLEKQKQTIVDDMQL